LRKRNDKEQPPTEPQTLPDFGYQNPNQAPPYFTEAEKAAWQAGYPVASPRLSPHHEPSQASLHHSIPTFYGPVAPPPVPTELSGEDRPLELHSEVSGTLTPSPAYADVNRMGRWRKRDMRLSI